ncbi:MAG TPA: TetR/AcrR family transcriptional regulator [Bryobacteraceae bacterium]|nr:TetR/AcrR family transcriptional regulator [Bryobacteraceae bacterium]
MPYPKRLDEPAIISHALELVRKSGRAALSMRTLAASLEVQASSLYRYFPSREALEVRLSERAAAHFEARMRKASGGKSAPDALRAAAREYVRFAKKEPALFELLLILPYPDEPRPAGKSLWNVILELTKGITGKSDDTSSAVALWSFLHGFTVLEASGAFGASGPRKGFQVGLDALVAGLSKS